MLFDNVIEQIQASKKEEAEVVIVKLGEVTTVTPGGRAYVKLYGDGSPSTKLYTYIDGYLPEQGDKVALLPQGKTYIILGKINENDPIEIYARIKWVEKNFCPIEYKHKLEDAADESEELSFSGYSLIPTTNNKDSLGSVAKNFKEVFIKKLTLDGESFTKIYQDRIFVVSGNNTYSLIATLSGTNVNLLPSTNDSWALGSSSYKLKEIWTGLFRGAWKSGQSTERQLSWNSSNALVPDTDNSVDLGNALLNFAQAFIKKLVGAKWQYQSNSANNIAWSSAADLLPNNNDTVNLGSASKEFNNVYTKALYINGSAFSPTDIAVNKLHTTYSSQDRDLTLSADASGTHLLPSSNNTFRIGSSSYKFAEIFSTKFTGDLTGDLTGKLKDGTSYTIGFDSAHNLVPSTSNAVSLGASNMIFKNIYGATLHGSLDGAIKDGNSDISFDSLHNWSPSATNFFSLGTSNKQFKNIYGQNIYVNGTAVSSDRRKKEDISPLDWRYEQFFKQLKPVSFKYKDGTSGRKHTGFIAQEVEEAAEKAGLSDKDLAVVVKDPEGSYYLRYEEIIAVQTEVIQKLMARVETLEAEKKMAESKLTRMEARLQTIEQFIFEN